MNRQEVAEGKVSERLMRAKQRRKILAECEEDEKTAPEKGVFDLNQRPYLRYYLNVAFQFAAGVVDGPVPLETYLEQNMPYSAVWGKRLVAPDEGGFDKEHPLEFRFGKNLLRIFFHPRYMEYLWGKQGDQPLVPFFSWRKVARMTDDRLFWLLLPVTAAEDKDQKRRVVCEELVRRLSRLPMKQADIPTIADCIAARICARAEENMPVCTLCAESEARGEEKLFGCAIYEGGTIKLYEAFRNPRQILPNGIYFAPTVKQAVPLGRKLLLELTETQALEFSIPLMPHQVMFRNKWGAPTTLTEEQITAGTLKELFEKYFNEELNRLELMWGSHSLVLIKDGLWYACFCFDHQAQCWYALLGMPEVYELAKNKKGWRVVYLKKGTVELPEYLLHHNPLFIRSHLDIILRQTACPEPEAGMWSPWIYQTETRQRYHLAMRQIGGYPDEQAQNDISDRFYIPYLPMQVLYRGMQGDGKYQEAAWGDMEALQRVLSDYMAGRLDRMLLIWQCEATNRRSSPTSRCLLLVQDKGAHVMLYMGSVNGSEMEFLVSDVNEYRNVDSKKCRKTVFMDRTMNGYLVHNDLRRIRDSLDLLIPQMGQSIVYEGDVGEFCYAEEAEREQIREGLEKINKSEHFIK